MNDSNTPATKGDIQEAVERLRSETKGDIQEAVERLRSETKGDIQEAVERLRSETKGDIQEAVDILRSEMHHQYDDLKETLRDNETKLLQAFYSFAESNQQRISMVESNTSAVFARLATLEIRVLEVEKRLNMPPAA